jgi:hypothetical protein
MLRAGRDARKADRTATRALRPDPHP